jgi:hypothetical protein
VKYSFVLFRPFLSPFLSLFTLFMSIDVLTADIETR